MEHDGATGSSQAPRPMGGQAPAGETGRVSNSSRFLGSLILAAVVYVAAGFFIDLPPRGIYLDASETWIRLGGEVARVRVRLTYVCTSWRPRRTSVFLPFAHDSGEGGVTDLKARGDSPVSFEQFTDGVILHLAMAPHSGQTVDFSFAQAAGPRRYRSIFGAARGWSFPPNLVTCHVEVPGGVNPRFSVPLQRTEFEEARGLTVYTLSGIGQEGVLVEWGDS